LNILIAGGTGFIGNHIVQTMKQRGNHLYVLTRTSNKTSQSPHVNYITWLNGNDNKIDSLPSIDVVINLAGDPINEGRWTKKKKQRILQSRKLTTETIIDIIKRLPKKPKVYINASAIGIYGYSGTEVFTEETESLGNSFPAKVCKLWENDALEAKLLGIRTVIARIGIVLGKDGGALPRMAMPYHFFVGGKVASGKQWISWIHIDDLVELIQFIINHDHITGPVNLTAPNPVQMDELGQQIGKALHRPHWIPVPSLALKAIFGEMSEFLIEGQRVLPEKALNNGFNFTYKSVEDALQQIYQK
jgi:uncharacterized protein